MPGMVRFHAETRHGNHPNFAVRKALAARVLIARNLRLRVGLRGLGDTVFDDLVEAAYFHVRQHASHDGETFSQFLTNMVDSVEARVCQLASWEDGQSKLPARLADVFTVLRHETNDVSCQKCQGCSAGAAAQCTGHLLDSDIVAGGARCLEFVTELFDFLVRLAERRYARLLPDTPANELRVRLKTRHHSKAELEAVTKFIDDAPSLRQAHVLVNLPLHALDETHVKRLPYMLFHEIFVHAPEGWETNGPRVETNELCAFREGFVDAAALFVLVSALRKPAQIPTSHREFARLYLSESEAAHRERRTLGPAGRAAVPHSSKLANIVSSREAGAAAFEDLSVKGEAEEAVRIAICLNRLALTQEQRTRALTALVEMVKSLEWVDGRPEPGASRWQELCGNVLEAARQGNAKDLFALLDGVVDPEEF